MPDIPAHCHVFVPGLLGQTQLFNFLDADSRHFIQLILNRALVSDSEKTGTTELGALLSDVEPFTSSMPLAAIWANSLKMATGNWLIATPVVMEPDRDRLVLRFAQTITATANAAEAQQKVVGLIDQVKSHFHDVIEEIILTKGSKWLIKIKKYESMRTFSLLESVGQHIENYLPQGDDGRQWQSILNEMQMLFHQMDTMSLGFNALWIEGEGVLPDVPASSRVKQCYCSVIDDEALNAALDFCQVQRVRTVEEFLAKPTCQLSIIDDSLLIALIKQSEDECLVALQNHLHYLRLLHHALQRGEIGKITLYPGNGKAFTWKRYDRFKFWRNNSAIALA